MKVRELVVRALARTVYRRLVLWERAWDQERERDAPPVEGLSVSTLGNAEVAEYAAFRPDTTLADVRERLAAGQSCLVVRRAGLIVQNEWLARGRAHIPYLGTDVALRAGDVISLDLYTAPSERGGNSARALRHFKHLHPEYHGERLLGVTMPENRGGTRVLEKAGYRRIGIVRSFGFGPWRLVTGPLARP